jgi:hypothetical protein
MHACTRIAMIKKARLHKVHCANTGAWKNSHIREGALAQN